MRNLLRRRPTVRVRKAGHRPIALPSAASFVSICTLALAGLAFQSASTQEEVRVESPAGATHPAVTSGSLQILDADGRPSAPFPLQHTDVHAEVAGSIARVVVEQEFANPYTRPIEAVYVFPLPHEAAVDDLEMRIGDRIVRGEIRTRQAAREIYEQARAEGRTAALLDQERPNIFTQQVANILPGHSIVVRIRYVENLEYHDGAYEMVFPTVVGPRFIPGNALGSSGVTPASVRSADDDLQPDRGTQSPSGGTGWATDTDRVPDASRITPPVTPPGTLTGHDIQIAVDLDAGVPLQGVECPSHVVDIERPSRSTARIQLRSSDTIPNKDFVLRYQVAGGSPEFGFLAHRERQNQGGFGYFSLLVQPKAQVSVWEARPKEMIFLLDCSGSMSGEPIARSKAAMRWAIQHLGPKDTFQIIRFSESASGFAQYPVPNTPKNVQHGLVYVEQLQGSGGTHMRAGIEAALGLAPDPERMRIVCFMTDGYIGNETEILGAVRQLIGDARLFSFGIGSSVNRYLLDELAHEGRGVVDYVPLDGDTRPIVERFYDRIAKPYLTDIMIDWGSLDVQGVFPARVPDLFAGQPLVLSGRYGKPGRGTVVVRGKLGRMAFEKRLQIVLPADEPRNAVLGTLWARRRIDGLMQRMVTGKDPALVQQVTDLALQFRLMTQYTSFVAVDNQVVNLDGKPMIVAQPVEMPAGVSYEGVFGQKDEDKRQTYGTAGRMSIPVSSVPEAVALNSGIVVQGGQLHVRGGRSGADAPYVLGIPPASAPAPGDAGASTPAGSKVSDAAASHRKPQPASQEAWASGLVARLEVESSQVLVGQRIVLRIIVRNASPEKIDVPETVASEDLALHIARDGRTISIVEPVWVRAWKTVSLAPGATRTYRVVLESLATYLAAPGRYTIELTGLRSSAFAEPLGRCTLLVQ